MPHKITFREAPKKRAMLEKEMVYDIMLNGEFTGKELRFNCRGYIGYLPLPGGTLLDIGERSFAQFKKEAAKLAREFKQTGRIDVLAS
jgi:hypothetical protein